MSTPQEETRQFIVDAKNFKKSFLACRDTKDDWNSNLKVVDLLKQSNELLKAKISSLSKGATDDDKKIVMMAKKAKDSIVEYHNELRERIIHICRNESEFWKNKIDLPESQTFEIIKDAIDRVKDLLKSWTEVNEIGIDHQVKNVNLKYVLSDVISYMEEKSFALWKVKYEDEQKTLHKQLDEKVSELRLNGKQFTFEEYDEWDSKLHGLMNIPQEVLPVKVTVQKERYVPPKNTHNNNPKAKIDAPLTEIKAETTLETTSETRIKPGLSYSDALRKPQQKKKQKRTRSNSDDDDSDGIDYVKYGGDVRLK